ncbi:hypothetical protein JQ615_19290 [Bradyrhizobium jicamae]|uniref:Resolvase HTH domain-containing protein n=1 Tax=Bradyrhizobium jicamae TaxID=280332 RepID=A0ABS5FL77_9BRAD|nr:hypothetical protein [Bradyrhizobium jicamae]MBR0797537.1 hypothetical protein [Bradyrhizobium jicamae]
MSASVQGEHAPAHQLSDYQREEAVKRRAAGESLASIAKSYAVDISMISRLAPGYRAPFEAAADA